MSPSLRAASWMLLPVLTGCLKRNPAYDDTATGAGATTTASATTGSTALPPTTDASSSGAESTSTGPPDPSTAPVDATTTATTDATTTAITDATTTATTGVTCATNDACEPVELSGGAYLLCEQTTSWPLARAACEAQCMRLVVLDEPENAALHAELVKRMTDEDKLAAMMLDPITQPDHPRASWWIGGQKQGGVWTWLDGTPMPPSSMGGWSPDNPDIDSTQACATLAVWGKAENDGKWFDRDCEGLTYRFVCELI